MGVAVTRPFRNCRVRLSLGDRTLSTTVVNLLPGRPFVGELRLSRGVRPERLRLAVTDSAGVEIIAHAPPSATRGEDVPAPATEPPAPSEISSLDELFITGLHLEQYRHATRCPTPY